MSQHELCQSGVNPNRSRRLLLITQGVFVPLGLIILLWVAAGRSDSIHPKGHIGLLFATLVMTQMSLVLVAIRFHISLWTMGIHIPSLRSALIALQSLFYFFFVPMSAGTELSRWLKVKSAAPQATHFSALAAIVLDRVTAIAACLAISLVSLSIVELHGVQLTDVSKWPVHPTIVVIVFLAVAITGIFIAQRRGLIAQMKSVLHEARSRMWRSLWVITAISLAIQLFAAVELWLLAQWLGIDLGLSAIALGVTGGALASVIPISLAGAGPAELGAGLLFAAVGASIEEAVVLTTLLYFIKLLGALQGGVLEIPFISNRIIQKVRIKFS